MIQCTICGELHWPYEAETHYNMHRKPVDLAPKVRMRDTGQLNNMPLLNDRDGSNVKGLGISKMVNLLD